MIDTSIHLLSTKYCTQYEIAALIHSAEQMRAATNDIKKYRGCIAGLIFNEVSTRTACSFQAAMMKLGGNCITIYNTSSSTQKGESLEDTIRTMEQYCDVLILRDPERGASIRASQVATKPLINAGDGNGEHPTQALLDVYTIHRELGRLDNLVITFVGDLLHSRTVHSLLYLLAQYQNMHFQLVSPPGHELPADIVDDVAGRVTISTTTLDEAIRTTDVLYMTRMQKERHGNATISQAELTACYLTKEQMSFAKYSMIVMHPLPRTEELPVDIDADPRAAYFRQMENGLYMRMAILDRLLVNKSTNDKSVDTIDKTST